ncbi:unnamed protein product [Orchesella dallaii]|uniref:Uncharacterized protein n=1 Tax=Orchesella dallaii TaxID=48710 RepID=A0ABP1RB10_9HEXA
MSMSTLRPTDPSAFLCFPTDQKSAIYEIFGCFRCQKIPHPDHYFICEEKGHRICSRCANSENPIGSSQKGEEVLASAFQPNNSSLQESCCTPGTGKLRRGPPQLLHTLLKNCAWECKYKDRGCTESFLGSEWGDHVKQCRY